MNAAQDSALKEILAFVRSSGGQGGTLARLDRNLAAVLSNLSAAGVDDAKRDAAVLGAIAALPKGADVDVEALAAALAEHGVSLDAETIAKAVRADLATALAGDAA